MEEPHEDTEHLQGQTTGAINSIKGFVDVMYENKKLPWNCTINTMYKICRLTCLFLFKSCVLHCCSNNTRGISCISSSVCIHISYWLYCSTSNNTLCKDQCLNAPSSGNEENRSTRGKMKSIFADYVLLSLGEFLIFPILICTLYGFINERAWRFDNGISGCNFLFFLYRVIMNGIYMKAYVIFLVIRIVLAAYNKYNTLLLYYRKQIENTRIITSLSA